MQLCACRLKGNIVDLHRLLYSQAMGGETVGVQNVDEKYRCNICGNEVVVTKGGGGTLVCCGQDMELIS